jgi:hypothetical protein
MLLRQCAMIAGTSLHLKIGMVTGEAGKYTRKVRRFKVIIEAYAETVADWRGVQPPHHPVIQCQEMAGIEQERLPIGCNGKPAVLSIEYALAYPLFQSLNFQTDGRLRQSQRQTCGREAAVFGHASEAAKQVYIYV